MIAVLHHNAFLILSNSLGDWVRPTTFRFHRMDSIHTVSQEVPSYSSCWKRKKKYPPTIDKVGPPRYCYNIMDQPNWCGCKK